MNEVTNPKQKNGADLSGSAPCGEYALNTLLAARYIANESSYIMYPTMMLSARKSALLPSPAMLRNENAAPAMIFGLTM